MSVTLRGTMVLTVDTLAQLQLATAQFGAWRDANPAAGVAALTPDEDALTLTFELDLPPPDLDPPAPAEPEGEQP